jgi:hypothetical protein
MKQENITLPFWVLDNIDNIIYKEEEKQKLELSRFHKKVFKDFIYNYYRVKSVDRFVNDNDDVTLNNYNDDVTLNNYNDRKTYLIKDKNNGYYKIGFSKDPLKRAKTLQSESPKLELVKVWDKNIEKELHNKYKKQRIRGEYFNLTEIQVRYICTHY